MTELSDQTLLAYWYRSRNAEAFHILAARHARMVYATALRVLRDAQEAQDVSQESFLALAQAKRPPSRNVAAWLHRTAYHAALDAIRTRTRRNAREHEYSAAQPTAAHPAWDDVREHVDEAVAALPDKFREPLVRFFFEQESHAAIAAALGVPRQTVTYRIGQGIAQVRARLSAKGIVVPAGATLAALVQENSAAALPMGAAAEIGRVALVATPSVWAVVATYTGGAALKVAAAILVVGAAAIVVQYTGEDPDDSLRSSAAQFNSVLNVEAAQTEGARNDVSAISVDASSSGKSGSENGSDKPELASLDGQVLLADGNPLANGHLALVRVSPISSASAAGDLVHIELSALGHFVQHDLLPGDYQIFVTRRDGSSYGTSDELAHVSLAEGEHQRGLKMLWGTPGDFFVTGTIVDSEGLPLSDVKIASNTVVNVTTTDYKGRFTLRYASDSEIEFDIEKDGYRPVWVRVQRSGEDLHVVLHANGAISGRVLDARTRKPVSAFEVSIWHGPTGEYQELFFSNARSFQDPLGQYEYASVYSGGFTVLARAQGYAPAMKEVSLKPGETLHGVDIGLDQSDLVVLTGQVVSDAGEPIKGAHVTVGRFVERQWRNKVKVVRTNDKGEFVIEDARRDSVCVTAWLNGYAPASASITDATTVVLQRAGRLEVEVYCRNLPLSGVSVHAESLSETNFRDTSATDDAGRATLSEVIPGEVRIRLLAARNREKSMTVNFEPGETKHLRFDVAPAEAEVDGYLYERGVPSPEGSIRLFVETTDGPETLSRRTNADGYFRFHEVPLGRAQLVASPCDRFQSTLVEDVLLEAGKVTTVPVDMTADSMLHGTITGVPQGEKARIWILRGDMELNEARDAAASPYVGVETAGFAWLNESGDMDSTPIDPGTYTLLLATIPVDGAENWTWHESRVVEIPESGELNVDFNLSW